MQTVAQGAIYLACGSVALTAVYTAGKLAWLGGQILGRELEKRRQRALLMQKIPAMPKRYCVRESFVAFMCAVRHMARFPKDIRQLLYRTYLRDAPSAPAPRQGVRVLCVDATLSCSGVPVKVALETHESHLHLFVLFQESPTKMAVLLDRILTSKNKAGKSSSFFVGHWVRHTLQLSKFRNDRGPDPQLELQFEREHAVDVQAAITSTKRTLWRGK